jgi:hypothetical protein
MAKTLEIEISGPRNESLHFRPIGRSIRGRFDLNNDTEPLARMKINEWPQPIPSQRLGIDLEKGEGYILEALHEAEHAAIRERIELKGMKLAPARETFASVDVPTWLFWLKQAVQSGLARVVAGVLPDKIEGEPRKSFVSAERPQREDRLLTAMENQNRLLEALLAKLSKE